MALRDKDLEKRLLACMKRLEEELISAIGPTPLRHALSKQLVDMRITLKNFDQDKYETSRKGW